jgi:hypothetical protein
MGERESMKKTERDDPEQVGVVNGCKYGPVRGRVGGLVVLFVFVRQHVTGRKQEKTLSNSAIINRCFGSSRILFHSGAVDYPQYRLPLILWFLEDQLQRLHRYFPGSRPMPSNSNSWAADFCQLGARSLTVPFDPLTRFLAGFPAPAHPRHS